ncbi:MAG TPA: dephospho-CoA kinase [Burkholderiaceae bacterium]|nr:dephospho-CoA kinase [Burkholderiaceae bacterium]
MAIRRIGLTGGIGSGKSTVAAALVAHGATLVDTDAIARVLTEPGGAAMPMVRRQFGDAFVDPHGALHRQRMRELAFADPSAKQRLEAILHPLIGAEAMTQAARAPGDTIVFDVPLMAESSHWRSRCDRIVVVDCSEQTQIERVMRRAGWQEAQVRRVIAQQAPRWLRRALADAVIDNDAQPLSALQAAVHALWALWVEGVTA